MKQNIRKSGLGYPNECFPPPCCCLATHSDKWFYVLCVATVWGVACSCQITSQHRWERFAEDCMAGWFQGRCEWVPFSPTTASLLTQSCLGVRACACVAFQPHGSRSIAQWILAHWRHCMYNWVHVCARPGGCACVIQTWRESMLVWLVFSKPFEALNDLIPSRYLKTPTPIPSPPQHYTAQCNSSPPLPLPHTFPCMLTAPTCS